MLVFDGKRGGWITWIIPGGEVGSGVIETHPFSYIWIRCKSSGRYKFSTIMDENGPPMPMASDQK